MRLGNIDVVSLKLFSNEYWNELDVGRVSGQTAKWLLEQTLAGATLGVRGQVKLAGDWFYHFFVSRALMKPEHFKTKRVVTGFQLNYAF